MKNIKASILKNYPMPESSLNELTSKLQRHDFKKKEIIIRGGVLDKKVYFIEDGITRSYCYIDGREVTSWFSCEGDITFGMLDLYKNEAGFEFVETLVDTTAYSITIDEINELYKTNIDIANWSRVIHQDCLLTIQCSRIDHMTLSAKEKYEIFTKSYPNICSRINLGYIASFLGITLPTLSKIRAEY